MIYHLSACLTTYLERECERDAPYRLDACLLTDADMALGPEGWAQFEDPFGEWTVWEPESDG